MHACSASSWTVGNDVANIKHPVSDVRSSPNKRSSSPFYSPLMTGLDVDPSEKRTGVESCEALNPYSKENADDVLRSEEHTSELQSQSNLVCRLLLEKKKTTTSK